MSPALSLMINAYELIAIVASFVAVLSLPYYQSPYKVVLWSLILFGGLQIPLLPIFFDLYFRY